MFLRSNPVSQCGAIDVSNSPDIPRQVPPAQPTTLHATFEEAPKPDEDEVVEEKIEEIVDTAVTQNVSAIEDKRLGTAVADVDVQHVAVPEVEGKLEEELHPKSEMEIENKQYTGAEMTIDDKRHPEGEAKGAGSQYVDYDAEDDELSTDDDEDLEMTEKEMNEYLDDLYQDEEDEDYGYDSETGPKAKCTEFPSLIEQLRQLRQVI